MAKTEWMDAESREVIYNTLEKLKITESGAEKSENLMYKTERLDPSSFFDNALMLRQINAQ